MTPRSPLALAALVTLALAGAGAAHGGHSTLSIHDFAFAHHVNEGNDATPVTLMSSFTLTVENTGSTDAVGVVAKLFIGTLQPVSLGLQGRQVLGDVPAGEQVTFAFERNTVPSPFYCVQIVQPVESDPVCQVTADYTLP